jgi:hypothetical protein
VYTVLYKSGVAGQRLLDLMGYSILNVTSVPRGPCQSSSGRAPSHRVASAFISTPVGSIDKYARRSIARRRSHVCHRHTASVNAQMFPTWRVGVSARRAEGRRARMNRTRVNRPPGAYKHRLSATDDSPVGAVVDCAVRCQIRSHTRSTSFRSLRVEAHSYPGIKNEL